MADRVWVTKEGQLIPYKEMDPAHLLYTLMYLRRRAQEKAQDRATKDGAILGPDGWLVRKPPEWDDLMAEALRRPLPVAKVAAEIGARGEINEPKLKRAAGKLRECCGHRALAVHRSAANPALILLSASITMDPRAYRIAQEFVAAQLRKARYDPEFLQVVEGRKFQNPDTRNDVKFLSLPEGEQTRIYEQWRSQRGKDPTVTQNPPGEEDAQGATKKIPEDESADSNEDGDTNPHEGSPLNAPPSGNPKVDLARNGKVLTKEPLTGSAAGANDSYVGGILEDVVEDFPTELLLIRLHGVRPFSSKLDGFL